MTKHVTLNSELRLADKLLRNNHVAEAREVYSNILSRYPMNFTARKAVERLDQIIEAANTVEADRLAGPSLNKVVASYKNGNFSEAYACLQHITKNSPHSAELFNFSGAIESRLGKHSQAEKSYLKALHMSPDNPEILNNLGNCLKDQGKFQEAVDQFERAIEIAPNYVPALYNLGLTQERLVDFTAAIHAFNLTLKYQPTHAEAFYGLGTVYFIRGDYLLSIHNLKQVLRLKPKFAQAYNALGAAYLAMARKPEAIESFTMATKLNPDYAQPFWNLSGCGNTIDEAIEWLHRCLWADPSHQRARISINFLEQWRDSASSDVYQRDPRDINHPLARSFIWTLKLPSKPLLFFDRWSFFDSMIERAVRERPFYEFGVWRGNSFRYLMRYFSSGFGFDTFEGLPEDWGDEAAGSYSAFGSLPEIPGGIFIEGKFEDTLPEFFKNEKPLASLINLDADLYNSTLTALQNCRNVIDEQTIIIFDEFIVNEDWENDEYKALNDFCTEESISYEVLAVSFFSKQVAIRLKLPNTPLS